MGELSERIRAAVRNDRYFFGDHADNMLRERAITHWQVVEGLERGRILSERLSTRPNPTIEIEQILADGTSYMAVWAYLRSFDLAKLVTVHFFDR